jgi:transposase-like protein
MPRRKPPTIPDELLDQFLAGSEPRTALAEGGLLDGLEKALAERVLNAEMDHHLDAGEPDGRANGRNGYGAKTVLTGTGALALQVPRDRLASFDPQRIAKDQRRFPGFDEKIVWPLADLRSPASARGMSRRESQGHLRELYGLEVYVALGLRLIHTTNPIEALHAKLRRAGRTRGHFPHDEAALKLLFLVLNRTAKEWRMPAREWHAARAQFAILFHDRLNP